MSIQIVEIAQPSVIDTVAVAQPSTVAVVEIRQGPAGTGGGGSNSVTSATTSDGTADLDLLNVTTATATVSGTLTADHIHGNLAGSVYAHVRAGEALLKGDPVYVSGFNNGTSTAEVSKADASNAAKMPAIGVMDANLAHNATGHMVITGTITDVNTAGYSINAELYVAAGGGMTATPPTARAQPVARVERVSANNGAIIVKVNGLSASNATPNTLVRRDASGDASFGAINTSGLTVTGGTTFGGASLIQFDAVEYYYGAGADAAHRTALGATATGTALFTAVDLTSVRSTIERRVFVKPTDTIKNANATPAADPYFQNIPVSAGVYRIYVELMGTTNSVTGLLPRLAHPANSRPAAYIPAFFYGSASQSVSIAATGTTTSLGNMTANGTRAIHGFLDYTFASSGTIAVEWAQNTSGVFNTTLHAGSYLIIEKLS
jgi:hypothetical protein